MNERPVTEARIATLISLYADRAPTDVDPMAMVRLASAGRERALPFQVAFASSRLGFVMLVLALLTALAGGALLAAGRLLEADPADVLVQSGLVEPFVGLPPVDAAPSNPSTGDLLLSFAARISALDYEVHVAWLYDDGRLIWRRNLEGSTASQAEAFQGRPTLGVIEQRLTSEGVERLRRDALAALDSPSLADALSMTVRQPAGVVWGTVTVHDGTGLRSGRWSDPAFPMRIAAPGAWLPNSDWADRRLLGYVPSSYLVCVPRPERLPQAARARLPEPSPSRTPVCPSPATPYVVLLADARAIAAALESAGAPRLEDAPILAFGRSWEQSVAFYGILPHGEPVSYGG